MAEICQDFTYDDALRYRTAIFEISFHVLHRETISSPTAKMLEKPSRPDSARLHIILALNSLDVYGRNTDPQVTRLFERRLLETSIQTKVMAARLGGSRGAPWQGPERGDH